MVVTVAGVVRCRGSLVVGRVRAVFVVVSKRSVRVNAAVVETSGVCLAVVVAGVPPMVDSAT